MVYMSSVSVVRQTHGECQAILKVLRNHRVHMTVRDVSMDAHTAAELQERLPSSRVPQVFVNSLTSEDCCS